METKALDRWAEWLLQRRHGGDPEKLRRQLESLAPVRERVLDNAQVREGDILLDVGAGDGLIAFGALDRVGSAGRVIFSDISGDLLDHAQTLAAGAGVLDRCAFVLATAEDLSPIADSSVDVVTARSVLIYVKEKPRAFQAFHRVLREGGRFSIFEPINRVMASDRTHWGGIDIAPVAEAADQLRRLYETLQPADDPMLDFDERDLLRLAKLTGFTEVHLAYEVTLSRRQPERWEAFIGGSGNPKIPSLAEAMQEVLEPEERERFTAFLRPLVERGEGERREAHAYLWGVKS